MISKLRYYLSIQQLTQIYHLIYPYISYSILAWGSVYKTDTYKENPSQTKPYSALNIFFCSNVWYRNRESQTLVKFTRHSETFIVWKYWNSRIHGIMVFSLKYLTIRYNTRYRAKQNFYEYKIKTNAEKQLATYMAIDIWKGLPSPLKEVCLHFRSMLNRLPLVRTKTEPIFHLTKFVNS